MKEFFEQFTFYMFLMWGFLLAIVGFRKLGLIFLAHTPAAGLAPALA